MHVWRLFGGFVMQGHIYSNTAVYGGNEYGNSGHLHIFAFLKHLMMLLKYNFFQGFIFTPYQRH